MHFDFSKLLEVFVENFGPRAVTEALMKHFVFELDRTQRDAQILYEIESLSQMAGWIIKTEETEYIRVLTVRLSDDRIFNFEFNLEIGEYFSSSISEELVEKISKVLQSKPLPSSDELFDHKTESPE